MISFVPINKGKVIPSRQLWRSTWRQGRVPKAFFMFLFMHVLIRPPPGRMPPQRRKTSPVHARTIAALCRADIGVAESIEATVQHADDHDADVGDETEARCPLTLAEKLNGDL